MWIYKWETNITGASLGGHPLANVYLWEKKVWPEWWKPWANTIAYYPLKENLNDYSGNNNHFSIASWTVSYSNNMATLTRVTANSILASYSWDFTILAYTQLANAETWYFPICASNYYPNMKFWLMNNQSECAYSYSWWWHSATVSYTQSWIHLLVWVKNSSEFTIYIDGSVVKTLSWPFNSTQSNSISLLWQDAVWTWTCTYWNLIIENKARTAEEISAYYNQTKSNYWL